MTSSGVALACLLCVAGVVQAAHRVVLLDNFTHRQLNTSNWEYEVSGDAGGGLAFNMYTPEHSNSYIKNGELYIRPTLTVDHFGENILNNGPIDVKSVWGECTSDLRGGCHMSGWGTVPPVMSALIKTKATIRYGRVEVVAKMPKGDWLWPAIWMLPSESHYGGWPRSGEIDIVETRGNTNYHTRKEGWEAGVKKNSVTVHWGTAWNVKTSKGGQKTGASLADGYHKYWMDWTASHLKIGMDGNTLMDLPTTAHTLHDISKFHGNNIWANGSANAPFDRPFYLMLNVAVGGAWFNDHAYKNLPHAQPWHSGRTRKDMMTQFWSKRAQWQPTWHGEDVAMRVKSVKMIQY